MSELKRYTAVNPYEQPSESEHGEYYLADDVDKRIEDLEQNINLLDKLLLDKCTEIYCAQTGENTSNDNEPFVSLNDYEALEQENKAGEQGA